MKKTNTFIACIIFIEKKRFGDHEYQVAGLGVRRINIFPRENTRQIFYERKL